jgi:hypothetical protein
MLKGYACLYAFRNQDKAHVYSAKDKSLQMLADLLGSRERLIDARKMLLVPIKEFKQVGLKVESKNIEKVCKKTLTGIEKDIEAIEKELENIITQHKEVNDNYQSICSVPHVGKITALQLLVATNNFKRFVNRPAAKRFLVYKKQPIYALKGKKVIGFFVSQRV